MKKLILSATALLFSAILWAQSGGPDSFGYVWRDSNHPQGPVYNWIDITTLPDAQQVSGLADDNTSSFFNMGFQFPFYWYNVSQYKVGSNGYIIFSNGNISSPFPVIPSAAQPHDYVAGMMSDLSFAGAGNQGQCWTWTNSSDTLIVSYINVPFWINATPAYTGANTFQIILSAVDSSITVQFMQQQGSTSGATNYMTIGIENSTGAVGLQHSHDTYPSQLYAVKFYYPPSILLNIEDAAALYNDNEESGGLFLSQNGNPYYMKSMIKNTGNQTLAPFNVNLRILNDIGATVIQENIMTDTLYAGDEQLLTATTAFNPSLTGTFTFRTTTQLTGDATVSNNQKLSEIIVIDTTQVNIPLSYTGSVPVPAASAISWSGGDAGVGVEIVPPFYPCFIRKLEYYIEFNTDNTGFYSLMYDNNGPDNGPGNLLDSSYVPGSSTLFPFWNVITLPAPIRIDSGSVFIEWRMEGANIGLGTDNTPPIGNRSYETLGGWAIFRYREDQDPMIRAQVSTSATAGITGVSDENYIGEFYPTPAAGKIYIDIALNGKNQEAVFNMFNLEGQLVKSFTRNVNGTNRAMFDVSSLSPGVYVCNIISGDQQYNRKFIVQQ